MKIIHFSDTHLGFNDLDILNDENIYDDVKHKHKLEEYEKIKLSLAESKTKLNAKVATRISAIASEMYSQITKGKYRQIFLISHEMEIEEMFERVVEH